jgi:hypothetical protein
LLLTLPSHFFAADVDYNDYDKCRYYSNVVDVDDDASDAVQENKRLIASRRSIDDLMMIRFQRCLVPYAN